MNRTISHTSLFFAFVSLLAPLAGLQAAAPNLPEGFRAVFNGKDLAGWHGLNPHSVVNLTGEEKERALLALQGNRYGEGDRASPPPRPLRQYNWSLEPGCGTSASTLQRNTYFSVSIWRSVLPPPPDAVDRMRLTAPVGDCMLDNPLTSRV